MTLRYKTSVSEYVDVDVDVEVDDDEILKYLLKRPSLLARAIEQRDSNVTAELDYAEQLAAAHRFKIMEEEAIRDGLIIPHPQDAHR